MNPEGVTEAEKLKSVSRETEAIAWPRIRSVASSATSSRICSNSQRLRPQPVPLGRADGAPAPIRKAVSVISPQGRVKGPGEGTILR
jgi:hypothetical protein